MGMIGLGGGSSLLSTLETDYRISKSLRFNPTDAAHLSRTPADSGSRRVFTHSVWFKRVKNNIEQFLLCADVNGSNLRDVLRIEGDNTLRFFLNGTSGADLITEQVFRDPTAWNHIILAVDTTATTASDRVKIYHNGVRITEFTTESYPAQYYLTSVGQEGKNQLIGKDTNGGNYFNGYLSDVQHVDGLQLTPDSFGELDANNVWQPKSITSSFNGPEVISSYPAVFVSSDGAYGQIDYINNNNGVFASNPFMGAGYIRLKFASPIQNVTHIRFNGGGYSQNAAFDIKINGSTVFSNLATNSSYATRTETITATDISSFEIVSSGDGWALGNLQFSTDGSNFTYPPGTPGYATDAGSNGYHLRFDDSTSLSTLGTDSSGSANDWTPTGFQIDNNFGITSGANIERTTSIFSFDITFTADITYEFFIRVSEPATYIYGAQTSGSTWNIGINSSDSLLFGDFNSGFITFSNANIIGGAWHFVRLTTTASLTTLYVDGVLNGSQVSNGNVTTGSSVTNTIAAISSEGAFEIAHLRITSGGTQPTTGIPDVSNMNQSASGPSGTLLFYDALDDISSSGTKTSDGGNVTINMNASTKNVQNSYRATDIYFDSPTTFTNQGNLRGNYAILNDLSKGSSMDISDGALRSKGTVDSAYLTTLATVGMSGGKWYWEHEMINVSANDIMVGMGDQNTNLETFLGAAAGSYGVTKNGGLYGANQNGSYSLTFDNGDIVGVAYDADAQTLTFYVNGGAGQTAFTAIPAGTYFPAVGTYFINSESFINFGQREFVYNPPSGHSAVCASNVTTEVLNSSTGMNVATYAGNNGTNSITGLGHSPDMVWIKSRTSTQYGAIANTVVGPNYFLSPSLADVERGPGFNDDIVSFDSDGFTLGADTYYNVCNRTPNDYVAWCWNGGDTTVTDTSGTITSEVRANPTTGFSAFTATFPSYTGQSTIAHGLGKAPAFWMMKDRDDSDQWYTGHRELGGSNYILLNSTSPSIASTTIWNNKLPDANFLYNNAASMSNTGDYMFYAWSEIPGYSSFGKYAGTNAAQGPFIYLGFRPRFLMIKNITLNGSNYTSWYMQDSARNTLNPAANDHILWANQGYAEGSRGDGTVGVYTFLDVDFTSNGFKIPSTGGGNHELCQNGYEYIYCAWAENPFTSSRAV